MAVDIARLGVFADLTPSELAAISGTFRRRAFDCGDRISSASHPLPGVIVLIDGRLRISAVTPAGLEITLRRYCAGTIAGLECLMPQGEALPPNEVVAETNGVFGYASPQRIWSAVRETPALSRALVMEAVRQLQDAEEFARRMASSTVTGRVAAALLELSLPPDGAVVPRELLASRAATARESVSRALHRLADEGHLELRGKSVRVVDEIALRRLATPGGPAPCYEPAGPHPRPSICPPGRPPAAQGPPPLLESGTA